MCMCVYVCVRRMHTLYVCLYMYIGASEQGGGGGYRTPHSEIWGGLSMFCPPPMKCVLINFIYIKSSILSLLIQIFSKECYQTYGVAICNMTEDTT